MSVIINGTTGISGVDGSASTPAVQGADTNTGVFFPAADTIAFGGNSALLGSANSLSGLSSGVFNYYALTKQGSTVRDFLNGNLLSTATFSGSIPIDTIGAGFAGTSNQFFGNIDEAIISNECLYTASFTPPTQPF